MSFRWLLLCFWGCVAHGAPLRSPGEALRAGTPALLTESTAQEWLAWQGAAVLGFFHPSQKGMGLKALAQEYKGRVPLGGVRAGDAAIQRMFNVAEKDLPIILVLQAGTVSMRLGGGSNQATLRTLISSAVASARPPPPPTAAEMRKRTSAATVRVDCAQVKGPCLLLVGSGAPADRFSDTLGEGALRVDAPNGRLARSLGYDPATMGPAALFVVKGNSRPRLSQFAAGSSNAGFTAAGDVDRRLLSTFLRDLREGALSFAGWQWPGLKGSQSPTGGDEGGNSSSKRNESPETNDAARPRADLAAGQYLSGEEEDDTEVIELGDDDE